MSALEGVLKRLKNVRREGNAHKASCPCPDHGQGRGDLNPSLSVGVDQEGKVLLKCFAGCENENIVGALGMKMADLFEGQNGSDGGGSRTSSGTRSTDQPCTLENYAAYVKLPAEFLKGLGLKEYRHLGEPAVSMPYLDKSGEDILLTRSRVSLTGKPKVKTRKGDKHRLYGLWNLEEAREAGHLWLVEGESDTQTLWYHEEPAAGIPGANGWQPEWAGDLEGIERLYFVVEDEAGEACWQKLAAMPELQKRLYRVELDGAKDVSELHRQNSETFTETLAKAREDARAWIDIAENVGKERNRQAWAACKELAESTDILDEFVADIERCRLVGETQNAKLLYLALTSRLLEKIISVAVKGPSSGGKSYLVKQVMSFFPETAYWFFTGMSERTLFYTEEPLAHRHIVLAEAAGIGGDFQEYVIRTLLSEGFLEYEFVEKTQVGLRPRRLRKEGPTGFITTTTRDRLHAENETRYLSLTVKDTREQTRRVFRALADERAEKPNLERWHALQEWLESAEHRVTIPYAGALAERMGDDAVRLRRDFSVILSLVKTHAVLHQATRETDAEGRVVATLTDYARVRELVADLVAEGVESTVPEAVRETVEAVKEALESEGELVTNKVLAEKLDIDKAAASRRARTAINRGYLENLEDRKGRPARLVVGQEMPDDREILPPPEDLEAAASGCAVDRDLGGIEHPPPPSIHPDEAGEGSSYPSESASTDQPEDE